MEPWFIATKPFTPASEGWSGYVTWSGLDKLQELVSLDGMLCPPILDEIHHDYWEHIVNEDFMLNYFVDLDFLRAELKAQGSAPNQRNLLAVFRNPPDHPAQPALTCPVTWLGYDLCDDTTGVSALSNCGGFPLAFPNSELNSYGLIDTHLRASAIRTRLREAYPSERHAKCHQWAIWRLSEPADVA